MIRLSLLDQSVRFRPEPAAATLARTIDSARHAERLGYHRFWVSEHHASGFLCGSAPEVLLAAIGAATRTIRLGSGGVMLPHYSAYKVAEQFSVLSNLYPGRVDLGVGRAPGGQMNVAMALSAPHPPSFRHFPEQVEQLIGLLSGAVGEPRLSPEPAGPVPVWMLGTSPDSAVLAARLGLPYAIALFINPDADPSLAEIYRQRFQPSPMLAEPYVLLATTALAADDADRAELLRKNYFLNLARLFAGASPAEVLSPEQSRDASFTERDALLIGRQARVAAFGTPERVADALDRAARAFGADEIMLSSNTYDPADRLRSLDLIARAFSLAEAA